MQIIRQSCCSSRRPGRRPGRLRCAFTLIEMMVVIAIIALLLAVLVPAMGPLLSQNQTAQAINTLSGLAITAQATAESISTPVGIRIERASKSKNVVYNKQTYQAMRDFTKPGDEPEYLAYQQARLVQFTSQPAPSGLKAVNEVYQPAFEQIRDTKVTPLPKSAWLAPMECIELDSSGQPVVDPFTPSRQLWTLDDTSLTYQPRQVDDVLNGNASPGTNDRAAKFNRMDTFYILFDRFGSSHELRTSPTDYRTHYWFRDLTQPYADPNAANASVDPPVYPLVDHPDSSVRGVLVYDRERFLDLPNTDGGAADVRDVQTRRGLLMKARPLYVSRSLGAIVEGRQ